MSTFIEMVDRIASELRRSNIVDSIKNAINDAIAEAAKTRFWFNEQHLSFPTVIGQEYYDDLGVVEIDDAWYYLNNIPDGQKERLYVISQVDADNERIGNQIGGQLENISRFGGKLRLRPVPTVVTTIYVDGYGKLTPSPLVADADTNAWLTEAEQYIRALAKSYVLRDVIRDYGEAATVEVLADGYKAQLEGTTTLHNATGTLRPTRF